VNLDDEVPVLVLHVLEADVAQNACIVDEDIDAAKVLDRGVDDLLAELDGIVVGDGLAASLLDLVDDDVCGLRGRRVSGCSLGLEVRGDCERELTLLLAWPSPPLTPPPRSLTTMLAPREAKKVA
jgi:hypothetical protein